MRSNKKNKTQISLQDPIGVDKEGNAISLIDILGTDVDYIIDKVELKIKISIELIISSIGYSILLLIQLHLY